MVNNIQLLDCTLRDGGHVNNAQFGKKNILEIVNALSESGIDIIELGFLRNGTFTSDFSNYNKMEDAWKILPLSIKNEKYSVMIRPDWYDNMKSIARTNEIIDRIRFAFYYKDIELTKTYCQYALNAGYKIILNPVNIMGYSSDDLKVLLQEVNNIHPFGVTIVDTFGSMQISDLKRIYDVFEQYLDPDITIGLHLHENMSSSFLLAQYFIHMVQMKRKIVVDGSLLGMGRIPGNLCIEMIMDYMNTEYSKKYILNPILKVITNNIEPIKQQRAWGYSPAYYFTGKMQIHRSYAEFLLDKKDIDLSEILIILCEIKSKYKSNFSKEYAEQLYLSYKRNGGF